MARPIHALIAQSRGPDFMAAQGQAMQQLSAMQGIKAQKQQIANSELQHELGTRQLANLDTDRAEAAKRQAIQDAVTMRQGGADDNSVLGYLNEVSQAYNLPPADPQVLSRIDAMAQASRSPEDLVEVVAEDGSKQYVRESDAVGRTAEAAPQPERPIADISPDKYTPESVAKFNDSGDYSVLERTEEPAKPKDPSGFRKEYTQVTKDFAEQNAAYGRILASAETPTPAGDLALIFNYMKVLDPGSVVRESEFATAAKSGSYGDRIQAAVQKVMSGERLSPDQRKDFVERAGGLYRKAMEQYESTQAEFTRMAEGSGFDPSMVVYDRATEEAPERPRVVVPDHPQYGDITEEDIRTTMRNNEMSREEVMEWLNGR